MDQIRIEGLRLRCIIGVNDWERHTKQEVRIDLVLHTDTRRAGASDQISDTVDYSAVAKRIIQHVKESRYHLIEALAESVAQLCLAERGVKQVEVSVRKPGAIRFASAAGVSISRARPDGKDGGPA